MSPDPSLILQTGLVGGSGDVNNVQFNPCGLGGGVGTTVQGCLNDTSNTLVNFSSTESLTINGGGQATIGGTDGRFDNLHITLADPGLGFGKLQFDIDAVENGSATFRAVDQFGTVFNFGSFSLGGNGNNFFTLSSADNQVAMSFDIISTIGIQNVDDLKQVRLGVVALPTTSVPEPASLALLGLGLVGLGAAVRRRRAAAIGN